MPGRERMMAEPASGDARAEHAVDRADRAADNELHQAAGQGAVPAADGSLPLTNERDHAADVTHSGVDQQPALGETRGRIHALIGRLGVSGSPRIVIRSALSRW